jgi:YfiH family protein
MNLGENRGDSPETVKENYRLFCQATELSQNVVSACQIHSDLVQIVDKLPENKPECDGFVTKTKDLTLAVKVADCLPILMEDYEAGVVAAVHAGWRGSAKKIVMRAIEKMELLGAARGRIKAVIGPRIGACCFETGLDVPQALRAILAEQAEAFIRPKGQEKFLVDLKGANRAILENAGVKDITLSDECTYCRPDRYWSHRRVGLDRGSMAAIIVCEEVSA